MSLQLLLIRSATVRITVDGFVRQVDPWQAAAGKGRRCACIRRSTAAPAARLRLRPTAR